MADGAGQIKRGRKFDQVLEGARSVFLTSGYEGASVDEIAKAAGVSKATLYSYFPDKKLLFLEVAKAEYERQADEAMEWLSDECSVAEWLTHACEIMLEIFLSEFGLGVYRMSVSEADRFPEIGRGFYESGPGLIRASLVPYFESCEARGALAIPDKVLAADQLAELCKADLHPKRVLGLQSKFSDDEKARVVTGAVDMFLALYGTDLSRVGPDCKKPQ